MPHEKKPPIVFDNGSGMIKCGFSGDDAPRSVFPSVVARPRTASDSAAFGKDHLVGNEAEERCGIFGLSEEFTFGSPFGPGLPNWDDVEKIWRHAFFNELHVKPEEHNVMLTDDPMSPKPERVYMAQIMFETFNVPGMTVQMDAVLPLFATGRTTGIVLDCGHAANYAVPIYEGHCLEHAIVRLGMSGLRLTKYLLRMLATRLRMSLTSPEEQISVRRIKEELCYVAEDASVFIKQGTEKEFKMPDGKIITIGAQQFTCAEALFDSYQMGGRTEGLHELMVASINKCDRDIRRELYDNIVLSGGTTMFPNFPERLQKELKEHGYRRGHYDGPRHEFIPNVVALPERKHLVWTGGSILAGLATFQNQWVPKSEYDEVGPSVLHAKRFNSKL